MPGRAGTASRPSPGANGAAATYICVSGADPNPLEATSPYLFPNWVRAHISTFDIWLCDTTICTWGSPPENLTGLTIQNFGTATSADLTGMYWEVVCAKAGSGVQTLTYAGIWDSNATWTWAGSSDDLSTCGTSFPLRLYADIAPCPVNRATVTLGLRADEALNPGWPGGLTDNHGCAAPYSADQGAADRTRRLG